MKAPPAASRRGCLPTIDDEPPAPRRDGSPHGPVPRRSHRIPCNCPPSPLANATRCHAPRGSADALLLARFAKQESARAKRVVAIVTAEPADTQRLEDELAFFAPDLAVAVFPDWETLPYDTFSPHQDLISERLATLWRIRQRRGRRAC